MEMTCDGGTAGSPLLRGLGSAQPADRPEDACAGGEIGEVAPWAGGPIEGLTEHPDYETRGCMPVVGHCQLRSFPVQRRSMGRLGLHHPPVSLPKLLRTD